jgi:hypothetical protein
MKWMKNVEPTIEDILSDPIVLTIIAKRSSPERVRAILETVARSRRPVAPPSAAPPSSAPQSDPA